MLCLTSCAPHPPQKKRRQGGFSSQPLPTTQPDNADSSSPHPIMPRRWPIWRDSIKEFFGHKIVQTVCGIIATVCAGIAVIGPTIMGIIYCVPGDPNAPFDLTGGPLGCVVFKFIIVIFCVGGSIVLVVMGCFLFVFLPLVECARAIGWCTCAIHRCCVWTWTSPDSCCVQPCARARALHEPLPVVIETPQ